MTKSKVIRLLARCIDLENNATTPAKRKYWDGQWRRFRKLAVSLGWID